MSNVTMKLHLEDIDTILARRGLNPGGIVQIFVDNEVAKRTESYAPWLSGVLAKSAQGGETLGTGLVIFNVPYAKVRNESARKNGLRGPQYFERMKADCKDDIIRGAQKMMEEGG